MFIVYLIVCTVRSLRVTVTINKVLSYLNDNRDGDVDSGMRLDVCRRPPTSTLYHHVQLRTSPAASHSRVLASSRTDPVLTTARIDILV